MKKVLLICVVALLGVMLCGCFGGDEQTESPLKKTYTSVKKITKKSGKLEVKYDKEKEYLELGFHTGCDFEKVLNILAKNVKGQTIGTLFINTKYELQESELETIVDGVSKIKPKSIMVFGMDNTLYDCSNHNWTKIIPRISTLYAENMNSFRNYMYNSKENLKKVKKLWLYADNYLGLSAFPNIEDLGIFATVESTDDRSSSEGKVYNSYGSSYSYPTVASTQIATFKNGETRVVRARQQSFKFSENNKDPEDYEPLKYVKKLKRLTIAPCFEQYTIDWYSSGYLFALSNTRNDIMINKPDTKLSKASYVNIEEFNKTNAKLTKSKIELIVNEYLDAKVKGVYHKAKKFKKKNKKHRITDKALVYMGTPDITMYTKKRIYHSNGKLLGSTELGNKFKLPERVNDYRYFVYAYPTYKYYGKYNMGTKAYTETYWVQVFDLDKKIAYKPLKVASKKPPLKIRVHGIPAKYAGSVSKNKIYKFIKKLQ